MDELEEILEELKEVLDESLAQSDYASKIDAVLRHQSVDLSNYEESRQLVEELNLIASFLGSEIMICQKESMWTTGDSGAAIIGLRGPGFMPDVAFKTSKMEKDWLNNVLKSLNLSHLEESAIMLRTRDGELIDVGSLSCIGKDNPRVDFLLKRNGVWKYLSDDIKQKIIQANKITKQDSSKIHEDL